MSRVSAGELGVDQDTDVISPDGGGTSTLCGHLPAWYGLFMRWLLPFLLLALSPGMHAEEVIRVTWKTTHAAAPAQFTPPASDVLPAFRMALTALPESAIVALALSQPAVLGLTNEQAATMRPLVAARYELIAQSPVYSGVGSALPYCFAAVQAQEGLALVHVPAAANAQTPVLLFLHGYGGSFLWYQHLLAEQFPKSLIICPAYGISTSTISGDYVQECVQAVGARLGRAISRPFLIGLSAGGSGACHIYTQHPERFDRLICLASYPSENLLLKFPRDSKPAFMAGGEEFFVKSGDFARRIARVRQQAPATQDFTVPQADHFFLLSHTSLTMAKLREWLTRP
ncbi:alpha/beta fold hydrolase [Prosthecobacter sp.]|uniref:alpha/beta fold hydrolase n=1 Tax=Prosthecobacter sp. TaxID=1965333 RepID=UPI0037837E52